MHVYSSLGMCVHDCACTCIKNKNVPFPFIMYVSDVVASVQVFFLPFTLCLSAPYGS